MIRIALSSAAATTAGLVAYGAVAVVLSAQGAAPAKSVWDGIYSADQAKRGQEKYAQVCSQCHQADLSGSDQAPSLAGGEFLDRWNDQSVGDLADRIRLTMPLDDIGSLNVQMSADITAYLLQANNLPAGQEELKADRSVMKGMVIKRK
ncbi:MAG: c-type cytochrome [Acidobacteriota bacterium]